jgi:Glycosyl transferases group 1
MVDRDDRTALPADSSSELCSALIVTSVANAASAAITEASFLTHHPDVAITVVVVDDRFGEASRNRPNWRRLTAADLGTGPDTRELTRLVMSYDARTLRRVVLPSVARRVFEVRSVGALIVLPDDAEVRSPFPLASFGDGLHTFRVRMTDPPNDGRLPDQRNEVESGTVDQECFVVAGVAGRDVLQDWANKLARNPLENSDHFDAIRANWLDILALRRLDVIVSEPIIVSYRNLDELNIVDAAVVRFIGFDAVRPWVLSTQGGAWPRVRLSEHSALEEMVRVRTSALLRTPTAALVEPFGMLSNGHRIDQVMRSLYRSALVTAERERIQEPPNPFVAGEADAFTDWLAEPLEAGLSRYLLALQRARPDVAVRFATDPGAYLVWSTRDAARVGVWAPRPTIADSSSAKRVDLVSTATVETVSLVRTQSPLEQSGINVVGLLSAQMGIGEQGRLTLRTIADSKVPFSIIDHDATVSKRDHTLLMSFGDRPTGFPFDVDLLMVNADQTSETLKAFGRSGRTSRPTVGLWAWEVQRFPERMHHAFDLVSEVWVLSDFSRDALQPAALEFGVRVHTFPMRLPVPASPVSSETGSIARAAVGVPVGAPMFAFAFDYFSVAERKQPWAVVDAFCRAFPVPTPAGPRLVIKSINHEFFPADRERLLYAIGGRDDVIVVEGYLPAEQRDAFIRGATAYVSLHRAEGYGLTLAEAMSVGTPTIATGWSGNMQFMTPENSFLVPSSLVDIAADTPIYAGLGQWAEPDLDVAASFMQRVLDEPEWARGRARRARLDLEAHNASGKDVAFLLDRLRVVRQQAANRRAPSLASVSPSVQ